ncbi:MAG TPA: FHA domain-containing protein [Planctomycetaceae bacterium]|jgi:pSer/pThr/pTyr-binding forkhead associated (FHA) protein
MASITIQVLEGFERGRIFGELPTPVTIGREEDNTIQLNDERVSRFHVKIQEDAGRVILTDLESTNGTRINGHPVQMRVLQFGDQMSIGRSLLLFGSPQQIDEHVHPAEGAEASREESHDYHATLRAVPSGMDGGPSADASPSDDEMQELFPNGPPEVPTDLKMAQTAQLSDLVAYVHDELAQFVESAMEDRKGPGTPMRVERDRWQRLLKLEMQLARYLREIADPQR